MEHAIRFGRNVSEANVEKGVFVGGEMLGNWSSRPSGLGMVVQTGGEVCLFPTHFA